MRDSYANNFATFDTDWYFKHLPPACKNVLIKEICMRSMYEFKYFFHDPFTKEGGGGSDDVFSDVSFNVITAILSNLSADIFPDHGNVYRPGDSVDTIYFIRNGFIWVYDQYYNFLSQMEEGGFVGEYQCMLDLKASNIYVASNSSHKKLGI